MPAPMSYERTNFASITGREADAIEAALRNNLDMPAIAMRFNRSVDTIDKIRQVRGISK